MAARTTARSRACVTMITSVGLPAARIRRSTSRPLVSGRWTSSSTRSRPPRASTRRASAPVGASATTSKPAHPPDVLGVRRRRHRVVLDDQRADHTRSRTGSVTTNTAPGSPRSHADRAARPAHRPPDEREPQTARAPVAGLLRAPAPGERPLGGGRVEAGAAVGDLQHGVLLVDPAPERDPARGGRGPGGVDGVVDEVADDRDEVAGVGEPVGDVAVGLEAQVDALLTRLGHLRDDERGQLRHPDRGQHGVGERAARR